MNTVPRNDPQVRKRWKYPFRDTGKMTDDQRVRRKYFPREIFRIGGLDENEIGVVPEGMALLGRLTAPEYLRFVGRMYGLERETVNQRTEELLEFMKLADERRKLITDFSHGMQKKLALAAAVIHGPKVLFLDEPFEGVDAIAAGMLKTMQLRST